MTTPETTPTPSPTTTSPATTSPTTIAPTMPGTPSGVRRAVDTAAVFGVAHSAATIYWACGGTWLLATLGARITHAFAGRLWLLWPGAVLKLGVALIPALAVRRQWPLARAMRGLMWLAGVVLVGWGGVNTLMGNLVLAHAIHPAGGYDRPAMVGHAWLWDPLFLAWGIALLAALRQGPRRR